MNSCLAVLLGKLQTPLSNSDLRFPAITHILGDFRARQLTQELFHSFSGRNFDRRICLNKLQNTRCDLLTGSKAFGWSESFAQQDMCI